MSPRADDMSRRHRYETAFDSKISKSDDDLDTDEVAHKSIFVVSAERELYRRPRSLVGIEETLTKGMRDIDIGVRPYLKTTPPTSLSLPKKFHSSYCVATVASSPDVQVRSTELNLHKSSKPRAKSCLLGKLELAPALRDKEKPSKKPRCKDIQEIKSRPGRVLNYSSSESMATSSSGGSLESIRSSTSEGNRSTSSCESRHSSSLSSHSSEAAPNGPGFHPTLLSLGPRVFQLNKLSILSPISDKSSQEPFSEATENNKNNNPEKLTPEEVGTPSSETQKKRRPHQNRNFFRGSLKLEVEAHNGSDSGISVLSRIGPVDPVDFNDLPFDMPKLRRRKALESSVQDTSGSATSVDLKDLPFDMPKLRRRQRAQVNPSNVTQASSTTSIQDDKARLLSRPCLSLDLHDVRSRPSRPSSMDLQFRSQDPPPNLPHPVDISCPLEEQKWYHGSITRSEAEGLLRGQKEASYIIRNSERTKQDYSLSCKCSRGFLHMRIQQVSNGHYVLGNFSKSFATIPELVKYYSTHRLPVGAEAICLLYPVVVQLL